MEIDNEPGRARTFLLGGAILSAITTIVVALIQIAPDIWGEPTERPPVGTAFEREDSFWKITGRLLDAGDLAEGHDVEIVLVPADGPYITTIDSQGKFLFDNIAEGGYTILVRHAESGLNERMLVEADADSPVKQEISLPGREAAVEINLTAPKGAGSAGAI